MLLLCVVIIVFDVLRRATGWQRVCGALDLFLRRYVDLAFVFRTVCDYGCVRCSLLWLRIRSDLFCDFVGFNLAISWRGVEIVWRCVGDRSDVCLCCFGNVFSEYVTNAFVFSF